MSSTNRTQLRLNQVHTGSNGLNSTMDNSEPINSLRDVMDHMATAIKNISGQEFNKTTAGLNLGSSGAFTVQSETDTNAGAELKLSHNRDDNSAHTSNEAGSIVFEGHGGGSGADMTEYAEMKTVTSVITNGQEQGTLSLLVKAGDSDTLEEVLSLAGGATAGTNIATFSGTLKVNDDKTLNIGSDDDYQIKYDTEEGNSLKIIAGVNDANFKMEWAADKADDPADQWQWKIADGGTMTLSPKIGGDYTEPQMTLTPDATQGDSVTQIHGDLTVSGDLTISGDTTTMDVTNLLVEDNLIVLNKRTTNDSAAERSGFAGFSGTEGDVGILMQRMNDLGDQAAGQIKYLDNDTSKAAANKLVEGDSFTVTGYKSDGTAATKRTFYVCEETGVSIANGATLTSSAVKASKALEVAAGNAALADNKISEKDKFTIIAWRGSDNRVVGEAHTVNYSAVSAGQGGDATILVTHTGGIKDSGGSETVIIIQDAQGADQTFTYGTSYGGVALTKGTDVNDAASRLRAAINTNANLSASVNGATVTVYHAKDAAGNFPGNNTASQSKYIKVTNGKSDGSNSAFTFNGSIVVSDNAQQTIADAFNDGGHNGSPLSTGDIILGKSGNLAGVVISSVAGGDYTGILQDHTIVLNDHDNNPITFIAKDNPTGALEFKSKDASGVTKLKDIMDSLQSKIHAHVKFTAVLQDGPLGKMKLIINHATTGGVGRACSIPAGIPNTVLTISHSSFQLHSVGTGNSDDSTNGNVAVKVIFGENEHQQAAHAGAAGKLSRDVLVQLKAAIEHANGHGSSLSVSAVTNLSGANACNMTITHEKHGTAGNDGETGAMTRTGFECINEGGNIAFAGGVDGPDTGAMNSNAAGGGMPPIAGVVKALVTKTGSGGADHTVEDQLDLIKAVLDTYATDIGGGFAVAAKSDEGDGKKILMTQGGFGTGGNNSGLTEDISSANWSIVQFANGGANNGLSGQPAIYFDESDDVMAIAMAARTQEHSLSAGASMALEGSQVLPLRIDKLELQGTTDYLSLDTNVELAAAANINLSPGGNAVNIRNQKQLRFRDADNNRYVGFKAANEMTNDSVVWELPDGDGSADQVLKTNASGVLSWADLGSGQDSRNVKKTVEVPFGIDHEVPLDQYDAAFNFSLPSTALVDNVPKDDATMVFANGQLLMSGTVAQVTGGDADYRFEHTGTDRSKMTITVADYSIDSDDDRITTARWLAKPYKAVKRNTDALEVDSISGENVLFRKLDNSSAGGVATNIVAGDIIEIRAPGGSVRCHRYVSSVATGNRIDTLKIDKTSDAANLGAVAAGDTIHIAAKKCVIHFEKDDDKDTIANGSFVNTADYGGSGTDGQDDDRKAIVVNVHGGSPDSLGSNNAVAEQLRNAINANTTSHGLKASGTNAECILEQTNEMMGKANDTTITETAEGNAGFITLSDTKFSGGNATGGQTLVLSFKLENEDIVSVITR